MGFEIFSEKRNSVNFLILKNKSNGEYVEVIPDYGATVNKICLFLKDSIKNILYNDADGEISDNPLFRGRILFPFNDAIPGGIYKFDNKTYNFDINMKKENIALHGFIYKQSPKSISKMHNQHQCSVSFVFDSKNQTPGYPFEISLKVTYILKEHELKVEFTILNTGKVNAPFSLGWHPYFTFDNSIDNTILILKSEKFIEVDKNLIPTRRVINCKNSQFDFHEGKNISNLDLDVGLTVSPDGYMYLSKNDMTIVLHQDVNFFKFVQLFIPDDNKSIAIEPISAGTNSFNFHELGVTVLKPKETKETFASVSVK